MNDFNTAAASLDPLDIEVQPGTRVRDLKSVDECTSAILVIEHDMAKIMAQIGRAEADPDTVEKGWRTRAQGAMRWKKKARRAVMAHAQTLAHGSIGTADKRQAILRTIKAAIGADEFNRLVLLAQMQNPDLDWSRP